MIGTPETGVRRHYHRSGLRRNIRLAVGATVCLGGLAIITWFPLALHGIGGIEWSRLSEIGQAYGTVAAMLTALTLSALAISVFVQVRDTRITQEHSARTLHLEVVRMAMNDPSLFDPLSASWKLPTEEMRWQVYMNLWIMLWRTLHLLGYMNEEELRIAVRLELFGSPFGHHFWERSRQTYFVGARRRREIRFYEIIDEEYKRSIIDGGRHTAATEETSPRKRLRNQRTGPLIAGTLGGLAAGTVINHICRHRVTRK